MIKLSNKNVIRKIISKIYNQIVTPYKTMISLDVGSDKSIKISHSK